MERSDRQLKCPSIKLITHLAAVEACLEELGLKSLVMGLQEGLSEVWTRNSANVLVTPWTTPRSTTAPHIQLRDLHYNSRIRINMAPSQCCQLTRRSSNSTRTAVSLNKCMARRTKDNISSLFRAPTLPREAQTQSSSEIVKFNFNLVFKTIEANK